MAESRSQAYAQKINLLMQQAQELSPAARQTIIKLLADASRELLGDIAKTEPRSYSQARLAALKAEIDRVLRSFQQAASSQVKQLEQKAYTTSALGVDGAVAAGTAVSMIQPVIDQKSLAIVQGYTADLISGITEDARAKINAAIQRAYIGRSNLIDLVTQVGSVLDDGKATGIFAAFSSRAVDIATNEVMRVHSMAAQARITDLSSRNPDVKKQWIHIPVALVPRILHLLADKQVRDAGKPFEVGGESLMYPRDPSGSAANTINCHCLLRPYISPDKLKPTDKERALLKSLGISVSLTRS